MHTLISELIVKKKKIYTVIILVNQLVSTFVIFSFEGEGWVKVKAVQI